MHCRDILLLGYLFMTKIDELCVKVCPGPMAFVVFHQPLNVDDDGCLFLIFKLSLSRIGREVNRIVCHHVSSCVPGKLSNEFVRQTFLTIQTLFHQTQEFMFLAPHSNRILAKTLFWKTPRVFNPLTGQLSMPLGVRSTAIPPFLCRDVAEA